MKDRNDAWSACKGSERSLLWGVWKDKVTKLEVKCKEATTQCWREFCYSLDKDTDSVIIDNVIRAMNGQSKSW